MKLTLPRWKLLQTRPWKLRIRTIYLMKQVIFKNNLFLFLNMGSI